MVEADVVVDGKSLDSGIGPRGSGNRGPRTASCRAPIIPAAPPRSARGGTSSAGKRAFEAKRYSAALKEFEIGTRSFRARVSSSTWVTPRAAWAICGARATTTSNTSSRIHPQTDRRSTIALVIEIDRQLAAAPTSATHASAAPTSRPVAGTTPPAIEVAAAPVEAAPATPVVAAVAAEPEAPWRSSRRGRGCTSSQPSQCA